MAPPAVRTQITLSFVVIFVILIGTLTFMVSFDQSELSHNDSQEEEDKECREAEFDPDSNVIQLTESNFNELILKAQETAWIVEL